jgi:uncharacterized membrane protein YeaQ/YmgE (transglycosylase-associated protein family)
MLIGCLMIGVLTGALAGLLALISGQGILIAFLAYVVMGLVGTAFAALTLVFPPSRLRHGSSFAKAQTHAKSN